MGKRKLTREQIRWLAFETRQDERTVKSWAHGATVRQATAQLLEQAATRMPAEESS